MKRAPRTATAAFERATRGRAPRPLVLRLYVAGTSARSTRAIQNAKLICEENFKDHYQLEVIDVFQQPALAKDDDILAVPTLIRKRPAPNRRFIGDLSDRAGVLRGLEPPEK